MENVSMAQLIKFPLQYKDRKYGAPKDRANAKTRVTDYTFDDLNAAVKRGDLTRNDAERIKRRLLDHVR
jgi:hypothetical protein